MSRTIASRSRLRARFAVTLFAAGVSCAATLAHAGIGTLVKQRAAETLSKPASAPAVSTGEHVTFTDELVELTDARVVALLAGIKAGRAAMPDRAALAGRRKGLQADFDALRAQYGDAVDLAARKQHDAESCWRSALNKLGRTHEESMQQQMMSDPAARGRLMQIAQRMAQAQAAHDTAGARKAQEELMGLAGATHADSVSTKQQCGAIPPPHPMAARLDSLAAAVRNVDQSLREGDDKALAAQQEASGQSGPALATSKERVLLYLDAIRSRRAAHGFSDTELKALDAHRAELQAAFAAYMD